MQAIRTVVISLLIALFASTALAQDKPNIVFVFLDNFGWGEPGFNGGGIIRGAATPKMDALAAEGLRLTNCYAAAASGRLTSRFCGLRRTVSSSARASAR